MPTYTYRCTDCVIKVEKFMSIKEMTPTIDCPACFKKIEKAVDSPNFILGGTGWARDGYTGDSNKKWIKIKDPK